ncbi:Organic solute transporter subunit alpha [Eumeta japonica]|uniref:Organic solute transporter subunit alpha n=1 Tax=Eumeta variegata TaxID=151549 RepID=A0A4C1Y9H1_EUMVA|nr:Organic solute transporter subunit alpha [Eumeta japonica]
MRRTGNERYLARQVKPRPVALAYLAVACASYVWLVVPRSGPLAEALAQFAVMMAMYRLQRIIIADCGGDDELVNRAAKGRLETRLPPCCCLPCCVVPRPEINKRILNRLRLMVLQMPIVQALIYIALLVLWAEDQNLYYDNYNYFVPVVIASILSGIWGMTMSVRAAETVGVKSKAKFLTIQLTLIVVKLQGGIFRAVPKMLHLPCNPPLTPPVYMNRK